jgi:hypothetical protein
MEATSKSRRLLTISIREALLAVTLIGACLGWWLDHRRSAPAARVVAIAAGLKQEGKTGYCCISVGRETFYVSVRQLSTDGQMINFSMSPCR